MNPFADLESIARTHCLLKPNGLFFLGIEVGPDAIIYNAHRVYGKLRMSLILQNWIPADIIGALWRVNDLSHLDATFSYSQPIWVLKKKPLLSYS
jgi:hypothetical protein